MLLHSFQKTGGYGACRWSCPHPKPLYTLVGARCPLGAGFPALSGGRMGAAESAKGASQKRSKGGDSMNLIADEKRVVEAFGEAEERNGVYGTWARELSIRDVQKRVRELFPRGTGEGA